MQGAAATKGWDAKLDLVLEGGHRGRTRLARNRHEGPLCVQRPFYPDPDGRAHVYLIHTPGGIVGGDTLTIDVALRAGGRGLLTTPAATKFYRSPHQPGRLTQRLRVAPGAILEWLPQETIVFDRARAEVSTRVDLDPDARFAGWEILCLGRTASGERFEKGTLRQRFEVWRDGVPLLIERLGLEGGDPLLGASAGLGSQPVVGVFATLIDAHAERAGALIDAIRARAPEGGPGDRFSVTALPHLIVCRYLGRRAESARRFFEHAWGLLRPEFLGAEPRAPRIWAT